MGTPIPGLLLTTRGGPLCREGCPPLPPTGRQGPCGKWPLLAGELSSCVRPHFVLGHMLVVYVTLEGQRIVLKDR